MRCRRYEQWLWDEVAGQLSPKCRQQLQAHLAACERCRQQHERVHATYHALRTLPRYRAPERVFAQVEQRLAAQRKPARLWRRWVLAPALVVLLALGWWGGQQLTTRSTLAVEDDTEQWIELHQQLEVAEWSPTPTTSYFLSAGYTR
ncbi:MAG: zf-HC2 domain-containing protein [Armatimonadota bacterium]|nr:zf-HC2 domain-containing protein [Armatimonadota bacterium]